MTRGNLRLIQRYPSLRAQRGNLVTQQQSVGDYALRLFGAALRAFCARKLACATALRAADGLIRVSQGFNTALRKDDVALQEV